MKEKQFFLNKEKKFLFFNKTTARPMVKGLDKMLNSNPSLQNLVEIRSLDITYGTGTKKFKAIKDMSLNIYKGEVLGLVGESGSGKSTTGSALAGLVSHSFGSIKILDKYLPKKTSQIKGAFNDFIVNKVQMIFQDPSSSLNPNKNIYKVVSEGLDNLQRRDKNVIKEIFLFNYDQKVLKHILSESGQTLFKYGSKKEYENILSNYSDKLSINSKVAEKTLYVELLGLLDKNKTKHAKTIEYVKKSLQERNKWAAKSNAQIKKTLILEMLNSVGLDESVLKRFPLEFSGGQQQRIGISRAIILRPNLLIADEPISALDVSIQAQVVNIFKDLKEKYSLTILFIAHDLRMVEYISDRIAVMNKGTLLEIGPTNEIVKNPIHPYTKSLLDAVPSLESKQGSLIGYSYDHRMHKYTEEVQPEWIDLGNKHFVLATPEEVEQWKKGNY